MSNVVQFRPKEDPQKVAADPGLSAFVTANAGSGKTKTLIDRVARILMTGAKPETILCVTYTKAAASEMQRRLYEVLGEWSVLDDAKLRDELAKLQDRRPDAYDAKDLSDARSLFAKALETPGGLKIQTIHAFCEKLLRRFPLEAGVSPNFRVMDDSASAKIAADAKALVARIALTGRSSPSGGGPASLGDAGEGAPAAAPANPLSGSAGTPPRGEHLSRVADAYADLSVALDFQAFEGMFKTFETDRSALKDFLDREGGLTGAEHWVWTHLDLPARTTPEQIAAEAVARLDTGLYLRAARLLEAGTATDQGRAERLAAIAREPDFEAALACLFTGAGEPAKWVESAKALKSDPTVQSLLLAEQSRLHAAWERMRAAKIARDTVQALILADAYLAAYGIEKAAAGALDFADLIEKTRELLVESAAAAWVLFKLDGGIDHILLDEAQDTAPEQWEIVDALSSEFFSGAGVGGLVRRRDLFVVGDEKQSIYSFQGAQPEQLLQKYEFHKDRATGAGFEFRRLDLLTSYRSTPQVLSFVDQVFAPPALLAAIQPGAPRVVHLAADYRLDHPGCVDIWPLEVETKATERDAWDAPLDVEREDSANRRLARRIAIEVQRIVTEGDAIWCKSGRRWRPAHAGDVLILVRRRKALFEEIIRALKQIGLPVAGADRLALSEHIVFDDLVAIARFALFPRDELTLAALLKSPFGGLDDDGLYALAHGRGDENLWNRLQRRAGERPDWTAARDLFQLILETAVAERPFELYNRLLGWTGPDGASMRRRLLRRLGAEAEDALDEFLNQVLAAEARGVHDLERLAAELSRLDITVKREMEAERAEVRVMTAHGAKGLEAPIVILPETTLSQTARGSPLMKSGDGFLWCSSGKNDCDASAEARELRAAREEKEAYRLLYVALTRARDRLILCGRVSATAKPENLKGWWGAIRDALPNLDARQISINSVEIQRLGSDPRRLGPTSVEPTLPLAPPTWICTPASPETFGRYASPSDLGQGVSAAASPLAAAGGLGRFRRGDLIHRLLQLLPDLPAAEWPDAAARMLAREPDLAPDQRAEMAVAALAVLQDPQVAEVFGPGSRPEVAIAGTAARLPAGLAISGRIDRLVVLPDRVLVVDFKTNRPSPASIEDADPAYLRQMALYAAVLGEVFPGHRIEAAIVWTDGPKLMPVPEILLAQALADLGRGG